MGAYFRREEQRVLHSSSKCLRWMRLRSQPPPIALNDYVKRMREQRIKFLYEAKQLNKQK